MELAWEQCMDFFLSFRCILPTESGFICVLILLSPAVGLLTTVFFA